MESIDQNFLFPAVIENGDVVDPLVQAFTCKRMHNSRETDGTLVRVVMFTNGTLTADGTPELSFVGGSSNTAVVNYTSTQTPQPGNPYNVWYLEAWNVGTADEVTVKVNDNVVAPPKTSRGTQTSVQTGTGNTIDE
ncbi:MAG: hypothetical protein Crog4KO_01440 [Crocinitomicaceae bacterium]